MTWLAILGFMKRVPTWAYICLGAVLALVAVWAWHNARLDDAREAGQKEQREEQLTEIINRAEEADDVRETVQEEIRSGGSNELYARCLRTARTPANCERFLPRGEADNR